ncbi:hypothetical protein GCM10007073_23230 [Micrococcus flavus]|nr:hypothetical protein GCM10007073_23230 [Micrococcus flavus]
MVADSTRVLRRLMSSRPWQMVGLMATVLLVALPLAVDAGLVPRRALERAWNDHVLALDVTVAVAAVVAPSLSLTWARRSVIVASVLVVLTLVAVGRLVAVVAGHAASGDIGLALVVLAADVALGVLSVVLLLAAAGHLAASRWEGLPRG